MADTLRLEEFWPYRVMHIAEVLDRAFLSYCGQEDDLSFSEWQVLWCLAESSPGTAKAIASRCGMSKTKASRAVKVLEDKDFLTRKRDRADRRFELLTLTASGFARFERLEERARSFQHLIEANVPSSRLASLQEGLQGAEDLLASGLFDRDGGRGGDQHNDHHPGG